MAAETTKAAWNPRAAALEDLWAALYLRALRYVKTDFSRYQATMRRADRVWNKAQAIREAA